MMSNRAQRARLDFESEQQVVDHKRTYMTPRKHHCTIVQRVLYCFVWPPRSYVSCHVTDDVRKFVTSTLQDVPRRKIENFPLMLRPMKGRREAKGSKTSVTSELTIPVKAVAILDTGV